MKNQQRSEAGALARVAGIDSSLTPKLEEVNRRRTQLWILSLILVLAIPAALVMTSFQQFDSTVQNIVGSRTIRIILIGLSLVMIGYIAEREMTLRRLTSLLVEERSLTVSLSDRVKELNLLIQATRAMNSALDTTTVLTRIADSAQQLLRASGVTILLVNPSSPDQLIARAISGAGSFKLGHTEVIGGGEIGKAVITRSPVLLDLGTSGTKKFGEQLAVPLENRGTILGVITVFSGVGRERFSEFDLRSVSVFADAAAAAITNSRAYEEQSERVSDLIEQDQAKDEFLTMITHELRTPLTSMIGLMTTLSQRSDRMPHDAITKFAGMAVQQGWRLDRLIEDLLVSSRSTRGVLQLRPKAIDVVATISEAVAGLCRGMRDREVHVIAPPDGMLLTVDVDALLRVLDNLITNAEKYTPPETPIEVVLSPRDGGFVMSVVDHGNGLSPEHLETIFEKFGRGDDPYDKGGMGLGLFVVKALTEAHGGGVTVVPTEGGGATFTTWWQAAEVDMLVEFESRARPSL